jgi:rhamnosyltransferase
MELARSDRVIFLNADATPGTGLAGPLVSALADPGVAAVFGRQIPRPDLRRPSRATTSGASAPTANRRWGHFFSMVSSGLRRDVWARRGFQRDHAVFRGRRIHPLVPRRGLPVAYCPARS